MAEPTRTWRTKVKGWIGRQIVEGRRWFVDVGNAWLANLLVVGAGGLVVWIVSILNAIPEHYVRWQSATAVELATGHLARPPTFDRRELIAGTGSDFWFIAFYTVVCLAVAIGLLHWRRRPWGAVAGLFLAGAIADVIETVLFRSSLHSLGDCTAISACTGDLAAAVDASRFAGALKIGLLAAGVVAVLWSARPRRTVAERRNARRMAIHTPRWVPPPAGRERRGVCVSGGGIRSAAFSLGVLQRLDEVGWLRSAAYFSAVSGGGYLAAGMAVSDAQPAVGDDRPWAPASPEEQHFRRNSSYLVPSFATALGGVAQLVAGLLWNLVLIWLLLFAVSRPIGWTMSAVHPELRQTAPVVLTPDSTVDVALGTTEIGAADAGAEPEDGVRWFEVDVVAPTGACIASNSGRSTVPPYGKHPHLGDGDELHYVASTGEPGLVRLHRLEATVVRQPAVAIGIDGDGPEQCAVALGDERVDCAADDLDEADGRRCRRAATLRTLAAGVEVGDELEIGLTATTLAGARDVAAAVEVVQQPVVRPEVGLGGRADITIEGWMPLLTLMLAGIGLVAGFTLMLGRFRGSWRGFLKPLFAGGLLSAGGFFLLLMGLPWLLQELPGGVARVIDGLPFSDGDGSGLGSGWNDYLVPGGGTLVLIVGVARKYLRSNQSNDPTAAPEDSAHGRGIMGRVSRHKDKLGWYELSPAKLLAAVVIIVVPAVLAFSQLQFAAANGPHGDLMGVSFIRDGLPSWLIEPEWLRWLVVVGALALAALFVDAHAWSLYPYYKRRLSQAYLQQRGVGEPLDYDKFPVVYGNVSLDGVPDETIRLLAGRTRPYEAPSPYVPPRRSLGGNEPLTAAGPPPPAGSYPQLVTCCAVNLSRPGVVPPSRRASSFTFSSTEIGGPLVGYDSPERYWARLRNRRRRDTTVSSAMSVSGAAFSPAMGKKNLGPVGSIMAVVNLRLGIWIPHPRAVKGLPAGTTWRGRPGWTWWLREVRNKYEVDAPYLYISDGGHWENLGLVELFRRGCTEIVCINAGGDGQSSFSTIGEAIALAREEIGVEVDLDPTALRPPLAPTAEVRRLRRHIRPAQEEALAITSFVHGTFSYRGGRAGHIWLVEPAITADVPFDVHGFTESSDVFPDDSTADQIFNHQQFEAFRALGYHQAKNLTTR